MEGPGALRGRFQRVAIATHYLFPGAAMELERYLRPRTEVLAFVGHPLFPDRGDAYWREYREGDLMRYLHGAPTGWLPAAGRPAFEHHLPNSNVLAALTLDAWPYLLGAMRQRSNRAGSWSGKMDARQRPLAPRLVSCSQTPFRRVMVVADRPLASGPSRAANASLKSSVLAPLR